MRHSLKVALESYRKINIDSGAQLPLDGTFEPEPAPNIPPPPKKVKKEKYFSPKAYSKKYREDNKDKITAKRKEYYKKNKDKVLRAKIIWSLNKAKVVTEPTKKSVDKYKIVYNKEEKRWE
jgi:hypothetical protein